jgi:hypothetical protein
MDRKLGILLAIKAVAFGVLIMLAKGLFDSIQSMPFQRYP